MFCTSPQKSINFSPASSYQKKVNVAGAFYLDHGSNVDPKAHSRSFSDTKLHLTHAGSLQSKDESCRSFQPGLLEGLVGKRELNAAKYLQGMTSMEPADGAKDYEKHYENQLN